MWPEGLVYYWPDSNLKWLKQPAGLTLVFQLADTLAMPSFAHLEACDHALKSRCFFPHEALSV